MSERGHWRTVRTQHLVDQQPLTREQVENIVRFVDGEVEDYEERGGGWFWHVSIDSFPEGTIILEDGTCRLLEEVDGKPQGTEEEGSLLEVITDDSK